MIFATWNPVRAAAGAYLFGGVTALGVRLQTSGGPISPSFLNVLPYIFTVAVLIQATRESVRQRLGSPAALGQSYFREDRVAFSAPV